MAARVLVAGVGNIFLGDDAFGVEVIAALRRRPTLPDVDVVDFGIRGLDLAFALERCDAAILVDAAARGGAPGTLYVLEPTFTGAEEDLSPHGMTPDRALAWIPPDRRPKLLRIVGCEPASLGGDEGEIGLSDPVRAAVGPAADLIEALVAEIRREARADA